MLTVYNGIRASGLCVRGGLQKKRLEHGHTDPNLREWTERATVAKSPPETNIFHVL